MSSVKHKLGWSRGYLIEHGDGTVSLFEPGRFTHAFRVRIADVTGVSETQAKGLQNLLTIYGRGSTMAECKANVGTAAVLDEWFRNHKDYGGNAPATTAPAAVAPPGLADQLANLAGLHQSGVLSDSEFAAAKARLISGS